MLTTERKTLHLWFDHESGRWCIGDYELHCGDCFQVRVNGQWHDVRIEMTGRSWYLIGLPREVGTSAVDAYEARRY